MISLIDDGVNKKLCAYTLIFNLRVSKIQNRRLTITLFAIPSQHENNKNLENMNKQVHLMFDSLIS